MATIRKRNGKFEVQVRRTGQPRVSRTFHEKKDALQWARQMEIAADRHDLPGALDRKALSVTLGALIQRYKDTITVHKRGRDIERAVLGAFGLHPICRKTLSALRTSDFAEYRDERLKEVSPVTVKRQLGPIHHLFEIARNEWGIAVDAKLWSNSKFTEMASANIQKAPRRRSLRVNSKRQARP
jgi:hypothetical protein